MEILMTNALSSSRCAFGLPRKLTFLAVVGLATSTGCGGKGGSGSDTGDSDTGTSGVSDLEVFAEYVGYGFGLESDGDNLYLLENGGVLTISKSDGAASMLASMEDGVHLESDDDNLYVLYSNGGLWNSVDRIPKDGSSPTTLSSDLGYTTGMPYGFDMESDGTNLYMVAVGTGTDTVSALPIDGSASMTFGEIMEDAYYVQVDNEYVYVAAGLNRCTIYRAPKSGGELEELGTHTSIHTAYMRDGNTIPDMEIHDGKLYWGNQYHNSHGGGTITSMSLEGGEIEELALQQDSPQDLVFHDGDLYWINGGDTWSENGELMRLSAGATEAEMLVEGLKRPEYLQVDDDHIYITAYSPDESGFDTGVVYRLER
jgi:hypothetical protein